MSVIISASEWRWIIKDFFLKSFRIISKYCFKNFTWGWLKKCLTDCSRNCSKNTQRVFSYPYFFKVSSWAVPTNAFRNCTTNNCRSYSSGSSSNSFGNSSTNISPEIPLATSPKNLQENSEVFFSKNLFFLGILSLFRRSSKYSKLESARSFSKECSRKISFRFLQNSIRNSLSSYYINWFKQFLYEFLQRFW